MIDIIIHGIVIGLSISVPLGPIGMLCIQRTLSRGQKYGLATGFGATTSDLFYTIVTLFFLSFVVDFIDAHKLVIQIIGAVLVVAFGVWIFRTNPVTQPRAQDKKIQHSLFEDYITSFFLTLSNPLILFVLIALFAHFTFITHETKFFEMVLGLASISLGAGAWWFILTYFASHFRNRINVRELKLVNQITGGFIILLGVIGILKSIF
ncbi:Lysine exporter protein (LYSE/YGGA) [uncultured Paludibacter sp.]|uniref:Lysine exporter protein (LYSE/YGGA) n=1 Tax=uncultured Paludibacter sp. TaxID=497635 RepID=A0A653AKT0_9BACT|nr:Lysine exporter protein (LYSE/YGGA) [uncultured Paludibacter sp.]